MFSLVIPTYGRSDTLRRAILSGLCQTTPFEKILIVDDNGDGCEHQRHTIDLVAEIADDRVQLILHKFNKNGAAARNTGLGALTTQYVIFLDDDDELHPDCLSTVTQRISSSTTAVYWMAIFKVGGKEIKRSGYENSGRIIKDIVQFKTDFNTSCFCFDANLLRSVGGFNRDLIRHQDVELIMRFNAKYQVESINECLTTRHVDSEMNQPSFDSFLKNKKVFIDQVEKIDLSDAEKKLLANYHAAHLAVYALKKGSMKNALESFKDSPEKLIIFVLLFRKISMVIRKRVAARSLFKFTGG